MQAESVFSPFNSFESLNISYSTTIEKSIVLVKVIYHSIKFQSFLRNTERHRTNVQLLEMWGMGCLELYFSL
jgi:hypothetical protein